MLPNDSTNICKNLNDSVSSSSSSSTTDSKAIKLQKLYYNRDASDSVAKSLLTINETNDQLEQQYATIKKSKTNLDSLNQSSALTNHLNQSFDSALKTNSKQIALDTNEITNSIKNIEPSSSCTKFLDLLLTDPQVITPSTTSSSSSSSSPLSSSNSSLNFKTLPTAKKLIKRLSIKSNNSTLQFGVKFINKVLTKNSSSSLSIPTGLDDTKMNKTPNTDLFLPSKKLRKYLPYNNGLKNHGNTCFMNCVLQSLLHSSPLTHYFLSREFEKNMRLIQDQGYTNPTSNTLNKQLSPFILSKHIQRLLASLWQNSYEPSYSSELKQLIGYLNPTFAGINQNDSHEFCVWLLDRLSQELTYKIPTPRGDLESTSFIEDLFKIEFKSTVICSKCNYKSSKLETDMMLSLPLPQIEDLEKKSTKILRRSLYCNVILLNENTVKKLIPHTLETSSRSKFYVSQELIEDRCYKIPFIAKIGVNIMLSKSDGVFNQTQSKVNPTFADLRGYFAENFSYMKNLIFIQLNRITKVIRDAEQIRDVFYPNLSPSVISSTPLYIFELLDDKKPIQSEPLINILAFNTYDDRNGIKNNVCYGLPFLVLINRDCTYGQLCRHILDCQIKNFKDRNMTKYRDLADKLFTLSLITGDSNETMQINPTDELPLYTEYIDKVLNDLSKNTGLVEHIRLLIKWRSYEDISSFLKEPDPNHSDYIHKTAQKLFDMDESESLSQQSHADYDESPKYTANKLVTLNDCFDMFTQCEELSDDNSWTCTKCKKQTNAYKKLNISSVPHILIIHLKRFFYKSKTTNFKLTTPVWFPVSNLDMSNYVKASDEDEEENLNDSYSSDKSSSNSSASPHIYDLFAVCNHKGQNMANGHYTAFCKNLVDTKWYCFDDSNCIPLSESNVGQYPNNLNSIFNNGSVNVCTENAYILFYKRRNCMGNEKWWINYIDRTLRDYNEFDYFFRHYDIIESKQNEQQNREQKKFLKSQFQSKVMPANRYSKSRQDYDDYPKSPLANYTYEIPINRYDEFNRPKRLSEKHANLNSSINSSPNKLNHSNSPSSSSSSKDYLNNAVSNTSNFMGSFDDQQLANKFEKKITLTNDYLSYPSDNDFIYHNDKYTSAYNRNASSNGDTVLSQVYYPKSTYTFPSAYGGTQTATQPARYVSSVQRQVNISPGTAATPNRYVNPKSIETPI